MGNTTPLFTDTTVWNNKSITPNVSALPKNQLELTDDPVPVPSCSDDLPSTAAIISSIDKQLKRSGEDTQIDRKYMHSKVTVTLVSDTRLVTPDTVLFYST